MQIDCQWPILLGNWVNKLVENVHAVVKKQNLAEAKKSIELVR